MIQATTPTIAVHLNTELPLNQVVRMWLTIADISVQLNKDINPSDIDVTNKLVQVKLTQAETLQLSNKVKIQLRLLLNDGGAFASPIKEVNMDKVLNKNIIKPTDDNE